ncbi:MAG: sterol desaturase family protein [Verrucomicrobia bacterium]|nr:sterol desaturase family protein [Deltaproteobacteria bacterium]
MGNDAAIRLISFLGVFLLVALAELVWPRRTLVASKGQRWFCNIAIVAIDSVTARLILPLLPLGMAGIATAKGWGIFNLLAVPGWLEIVMVILIFDLIIYLQHRSFHRVPLFWRFHRMHHTDLDLDVSSGNRFHPIEILVSLLIKLAAVALLGAPAVAVVIFEVALNANSLFNHGNLRIPTSVDSWLRLFIVTPDMHRVHHSIIPRETDSNFSFNLPWWDRMLGTYRDQPREGHIGMIIGLKEFRDEQKLGLGSLLMLPFRGRNG